MLILRMIAQGGKYTLTICSAERFEVNTSVMNPYHHVLAYMCRFLERTVLISLKLRLKCPKTSSFAIIMSSFKGF